MVEGSHAAPAEQPLRIEGGENAPTDVVKARGEEDGAMEAAARQHG